jgi:hypothetical protein
MDMTDGRGGGGFLGARSVGKVYATGEASRGGSSGPTPGDLEPRAHPRARFGFVPLHNVNIQGLRVLWL